MKVIILAILILAISADRLLITPEYTEYLKNHVSWTVADYEENVFKGWTEAEFMNMLGDKDIQYIPPLSKTPKVGANLPSEVNWRGANCVHEIHNQGNCGSCWAFATASVVSDKCCMGKKDFGWLSPQELVSCDTDENSGCNGGLAALALQYVKSNGLVQEECYPYVGQDEACPSACKSGSDWAAAHVCKPGNLIDCGTLPSMKACLQKGPITARMLVYRDFTSYKEGVYCWDKKSSFLGGHAIRCLGYSEDPKPHLLCANSWGPTWGDKGCFKISTVDGCGIRLTAHDAWTAEDY